MATGGNSHRFTMRRSLSARHGFHDGSAEQMGRERDRDRDRSPGRGAQAAATTEDQIAEIRYILARLEQKISNQGSDLSILMKFKDQSTEELKLQKTKIEAAENEIKEKLKDMASQIAVLRASQSEVYVGTPVRPEHMPNAAQNPAQPTGAPAAPPGMGANVGPFAMPPVPQSPWTDTLTPTKQQQNVPPNQHAGGNPPRPSGDGFNIPASWGHMGSNTDWRIDRKVTKSIEPFNGTSMKYRNWHDRMHDHLVRCNVGYARLLKLIENESYPLTCSRLMHGIPGFNFDPYFVSLQLWTFIGENLDNSLYERRIEKAGEDENGIESCRKLFVTHWGGSKQVQVSGMESLHSFPPCERNEDLNDWLGMWNQCRLQYGTHLPDDHLRVMLEEKLPPSISKDLREQRHLNTLDQCLDHLWAEIARLNDTKIAHLHSQRLKQMLSKKSVNAVTENTPNVESANPVPSATDPNVVALVNQVNQLTQVVAAMGPRPKAKSKPKAKSGSKLPTPDPKFEGCWHCKDTSHSRRQCPDFKALLKANGGKLPEGYEGAYEKWCKKNGKRVAAILDLDGESDDESDWSETDLGLCAAMQCLPCNCADEEVVTSNSFSALSEDNDDVEDDEEEVVAALHQISRSVTVGKKPSQKQRKTARSPDPVSRTKIMKIVASLKNGTMQFPELVDECEDDRDFDHVWALMDSGSFVNIANHSKHFPNSKLRPSELQRQGNRCAAANGSEIAMKEEMVVKAYTDNGDKAQVTFQNGDVHLPILSVARLSDHHYTLFHDTGGTLTHRKSKRQTKFVKKDGVYFIRLRVPNGKGRDTGPNSSDFHRPGD